MKWIGEIIEESYSKQADRRSDEELSPLLQLVARVIGYSLGMLFSMALFGIAFAIWAKYNL